MVNPNRDCPYLEREKLKNLAKVRYAIGALASFVVLEIAMLAGLYLPTERGWLDAWVMYPAAFVLVITTYLTVSAESRKYLVQPVLALIAMMVAADMQESDPNRIVVGAFIVHLAAIVWFVSTFMRFVSMTPPDDNNHLWLSRVSGGALALMELLHVAYLVHRQLPALNSQGRDILISMGLATVAFGVFFSLILFFHVRYAPTPAPNTVVLGQGS